MVLPDPLANAPKSPTGGASVRARSYHAFEDGHGASELSVRDSREYQLHARTMPFDGDLGEVRRLFGSHPALADAIGEIFDVGAGADGSARVLVTRPSVIRLTEHSQGS
jgi:hypothetical protein